MLKFTIPLIFILLFVKHSYSQVDNFYSLYQYNPNIVNPAYAGSHEQIDFGVMRDWMYVHLFDLDSPEGLPRFFKANIHSPVGENFGAGFSFETGDLGFLKENIYNLDFSYRFKPNEASLLSIGIRGGLSFLNFDAMPLEDDFEQIYNKEVQNKLKNIGSGIYFYTDKFYAGLAYLYYFGSYPEVEGNLLVTDDNYNMSDLNGFTGYVFELSEKVKFKPSIMFFYNSKIEETWFYLSGNVYFDKIIDLGVHYNFSKAVAFTINSPEILKTFKLGLSVDMLERSKYLDKSYQNITLFTNFSIDAFGKNQTNRYF